MAIIEVIDRGICNYCDSQAVALLSLGEGGYMCWKCLEGFLEVVEPMKRHQAVLQVHLEMHNIIKGLVDSGYVVRAWNVAGAVEESEYKEEYYAITVNVTIKPLPVYIYKPFYETDGYRKRARELMLAELDKVRYGLLAEYTIWIMVKEEEKEI